MAKKKLSTNIIEPSIRNNGEKHLLEEMYEAGEYPEMKAVGYCQIGKSANSWIPYTITIKGNTVTNIKVEELQPKALAEESSKLAFVEHLMDQE